MILAADSEAGAREHHAVTTDVVVLTVREGDLRVLLVQRGRPPFQGELALPGGFVDADEDLEHAARRELLEETGLALPTSRSHDDGYVEQLRTYGSPGRDPRGPTVSVAYLAMVPDAPEPRAGDDADRAMFVPVAHLLDHGSSSSPGPELAFDHALIVSDAVERARSKLEYSTLATAFVNEPFTLADLRSVYEAVWGVDLHEANFRRKVLSTPGFVRETGTVTPTAGRPARQYRRGRAAQLHPALLRPQQVPRTGSG